MAFSMDITKYITTGLMGAMIDVFFATVLYGEGSVTCGIEALSELYGFTWAPNKTIVVLLLVLLWPYTFIIITINLFRKP